MKINFFYLLVFSFLISVSWVSASNINIESDKLNIIDRGKKNEFVGNVKISGDGLSVLSARAVSEIESGMVMATGGVKIKFSSGTMKLEGESREAEIDDTNKEISLKGDVQAIYHTTQEEPIMTYSDQMGVYYRDPRSAVFTGKVRVEREGMYILSEKVVFLETEEEIVFTGNPRGESQDESDRAEYSGDLIRVSSDGERISIEGDARVLLEIQHES
ncbi:MAG: hypothetical protein GX817_05910 [Elusimicrobia bacterium]|nr:hypothetical protein [Elusimicrobiota bacterium]